MHPRTSLAVREKSWLWQLYVVAITVAVGLFLAWLSNKLLIDEYVKRAMTRIYSPLLSLSYSDKGQQDIAVLTLDDADLREYGLNWPVPLDYYQRLVDGVVKRHPKAIFLDVVFLDNRPEREVQSLIGAACRATEAAIPFFLATFAREALSSHTEKTIFGARTKAGQPCVIPVRSNVSPDALDQAQWAYPLRPLSEDEVAKASSLPVSAALAIYCNLYPATCPTHAEVALALIWATRTTSSNLATMVTRNEHGTLVAVCRGSWNWWEILPGATMIYEISLGPLLPLCPYNQVIPVRAFKGFGFSSNELDNALAGKIVMIGADLKAIGDNVFSPLHGRLPGVHVHAMALDNLITFHGAYRENGEFEWHHGWHVRSNLFVFWSLLLTAMVMVLWKHRKEEILNKSLSQEISPRKEFEHWSVVLWLRAFQSRHTGSRMIAGTVWLVLGAVKLGVRLSLLIFLPLLLVLGWPRFDATAMTRCKFRLSAIGLVIYVALAVAIFYLGYFYYFQGPLAIIEYVMFPLMAHFLHVGEAVAEHTRQLSHALRAGNPWEEWAKQGRDL